MSLIELVAMVPPPAKPLEVGRSADWEGVQHTLGISLPTDLLVLCDTYGSGWFGKIQVYNPYSINYIERINTVISCYRELKNYEGDGAVPYKLFPDQPGIFPCGGNDEDGAIFWITEGKPDQWSLLLRDAGPTWQRLEISITTFLARTFSLELPCIWWDNDWQRDYLSNVTFRPALF